MIMRSMFFIFCVVLLTACATTAPEMSKSSDLTGLPTSELDPGKCGLFGWSTNETREFVFYADEKTARYAGLEGPIDLIAQSAFPSTEYKDIAGEAVTLRLGEGEVMNGGMRYPGARVVTLTQDGWERLHPVAIVKTCQPRS